MTDQPEPMTRQERQDLARLVKLRESTAKKRVESFSAERLAQFEQEMATVYKADDERWAAITQAVADVATKANEEIGRICEAEGINTIYRPYIRAPSFSGRGENADGSRRVELRKVATSRLAADAKAAKLVIEEASGSVQEQLLIGGLRTDEAKARLESMPNVEQLMPPLPVAEIIAIEEASSGKRKDWRARGLAPLMLTEGEAEDEDGELGDKEMAS
jgi:hypothetical protein